MSGPGDESHSSIPVLGLKPPAFPKPLTVFAGFRDRLIGGLAAIWPHEGRIGF